jgi:hypothetical protein
MLWLYIARARAAQDPAGQMAIRDELARGGAQLNLAQWPGPVFSLFIGTANEQAVFSAASASSALKCEAYVFVAENDLLERRKENASKLFRTAIATCATWSPYFEVAKTELERLDH